MRTAMPSDPTYPGVYVEEISWRSKPIDGVDTCVPSEAAERLLAYAGRKVCEFEAAEERSLRDIIRPNWRPRTDILRTPGVYVVYSRGRPIYVGMAGKGGHHLNYRLGDMFAYSRSSSRHFHHALTDKLLTKDRRFARIGQVREYLLSCKVKTVETSTFKQARTLEALLIELLKPKYND